MQVGLKYLGSIPGVRELTKGLYQQHGYTSFINYPIAFGAEHLEVLYDIDYECKVVTDELGVNYFFGLFQIAYFK